MRSEICGEKHHAKGETEEFKDMIAEAESSGSITLKDAKASWARRRKELLKLNKSLKFHSPCSSIGYCIIFKGSKLDKRLKI